jgi:hypothetical protein
MRFPIRVSAIEYNSDLILSAYQQRKGAADTRSSRDNGEAIARG